MKKFTARVLPLAFVLSLSSCGWLGNFNGNNSSTSTQSTKGTGNGSPNNPFSPPSGSGAALVIYAPSPANVGMCWPATVTATNSGLAANVASMVTANIAVPANMTAYSNSSCTNIATSVTIPTGSASASLWLKSSAQGSFAISATDSSATFATGAATLGVDGGNNPNMPVRMALVGATTANAGACTAYTASLYSSTNNPASFSTSTSLNLSSSSSDGVFYSAGCSGSGTSSVTVPAGGSSVTFYHKNNVAGLVSLNAMANNIYGDLNVLIAPASPSKAIVQGPATVMTGGCYPYSVVSKDLYDNPSPVSANTSSPLSLSGVGAIYSDASCNATVNNTVIAAGNASGLFYFRSLTGGAATVTPNPSGLAGVGLTVSVNLSSGNAPAKLAFDTTADSTTAGSCLGPLYLRVQDTNGNTLVASANVNLSNTGNGEFFSDSSCLNNISSIATGNAIYFRDLKSETLQINGNDSAGQLASASKSMNVGYGPLYQMVLLGSSTTFTAGSCAPLSVGYADPYLNAVPLSSTRTATLKEIGLNTGLFYSDAACASALPSVSGGQGLAFAVGQFQKSVYFRENKAGAGRLEATDGALNPGVYNFNVAAGDPKTVTVTKSPGTIVVGECGGPVELSLFDEFNNLTTARSSMPFSVASSAGAFFSDASCGNSTSNVTFGIGSSMTQVYFKPSGIGLVTGSLTPTMVGCTGTTFTVQVNPSGTQARLAVVGVAPRTPRGPAASFAGTCMEFAVQAEDANGNPAQGNVNIAVDLAEVFSSGSPSPSSVPKFYASAGCANAVTGVTIAAGSTRTSFWYKGTAAGLLNLKASSGLLAVQTYQVTMNVGPAVSLQFHGPSNGVADVCAGPFSVSGMDAFGNPSPLVNGTVLSLSGNGQGAYYASAGCSGASTNSVTVNSPAVQGAFFFKNKKAENLTLSVAASGLGYTDRAFNVVPGNDAMIGLVGSLSAPATVCSAPLRLQVSDSNGNITTSLTPRTYVLAQQGTVTFYSNAGCTLVANATQIAAGQAMSAPFYFRAVSPQHSVMSATQSPGGLVERFQITIGAPPCSGTNVFVQNPGGIKDAVNAVTPGAILEAALFDNVTAQKICSVLGRPVVTYKDSWVPANGGRRGFHSPGNNTLTRWVPPSGSVPGRWLTAGAKTTTPYNQWIATLTCSCQ